MTLVCAHCHHPKPESDFWRNRSRPTGRQASCITCLKAYPNRKAARRRWERVRRRPGSYGPRPRIYDRTKALIEENLDLAYSIKYADELGLRYLCLVRMAELHADDGTCPAKFRSLVKRRIRGASHTQYLEDLGYRHTRDRDGKCYNRRFTASFTDSRMPDAFTRVRGEPDD